MKISIYSISCARSANIENSRKSMSFRFSNITGAKISEDYHAPASLTSDTNSDYSLSLSLSSGLKIFFNGIRRPRGRDYNEEDENRVCMCVCILYEGRLWKFHSGKILRAWGICARTRNFALSLSQALSRVCMNRVCCLTAALSGPNIYSAARVCVRARVCGFWPRAMFISLVYISVIRVIFASASASPRAYMYAKKPWRSNRRIGDWLLLYAWSTLKCT